MTLHVVYNHQCAGCQAFYVPFDDVPCPRCGLREEERFDYIPQAAQSLRYNKETGGSYRPGAWWVGSLGDHILNVLFGVFDGYEADGHAGGLPGYAAEHLGGMDWGEQEYLRDHVRDIAVRIASLLNVP